MNGKANVRPKPHQSPQAELCAVCGCSKHVAVHRPILHGVLKGKPLDHAFEPRKPS